MTCFFIIHTLIEITEIFPLAIDLLLDGLTSVIDLLPKELADLFLALQT